MFNFNNNNNNNKINLVELNKNTSVKIIIWKGK